MKKVFSVLLIITFLISTISTNFVMPQRAFAASNIGLTDAQAMKIVQSEINTLKLLQKEYNSLEKQKKPF
ncbi:hypothetical protein ACSYGW_07085 [Bacillus glycinifermentans]|uniref:hypothetical protein n=1 Tax=Bacillus glycinifermentans TaxID=1664069 RepID=UPI00405A04B1